MSVFNLVRKKAVRSLFIVELSAHTCTSAHEWAHTCSFTNRWRSSMELIFHRSLWSSYGSKPDNPACCRTPTTLHTPCLLNFSFDKGWTLAQCTVGSVAQTGSREVMKRGRKRRRKKRRKRGEEEKGDDEQRFLRLCSLGDF